MTVRLYYPPTQNGLQKTLDAALDSAHTTALTLNNITGIQNKPGVVVIDRIDSGGTEKSSSVREFVAYTGTSGVTLTGLTRAIGGSTDQDHAVGAVVEFVLDITWSQAIIDALTAEHGTDGTHDTTKVVDLATAQTLTNKTLTNPTINFTDKNITMNVKCAVTLGTDQNNITATTFTRVLFDTEVYDTGSDFDTVNHRFTAPVSGYYLVNLGISWSSPVADTYYSCAVYVNGTRVDRTWSFFHASAINFLTSSVSAVVYVAAGQYIEGYVYHTGGADTPDLRSGRTYMDITLLSI